MRPNQHTAGWTDERTASLKRLWAAGHSAAEIARTIGGDVTRCAVIGKLHRLGASKREIVLQTAPSSPPPRRSAFALAEFDPVVRRAVAAWTNEISKTNASNEQDGEQYD